MKWSQCFRWTLLIVCTLQEAPSLANPISTGRNDFGIVRMSEASRMLIIDRSNNTGTMIASAATNLNEIVSYTRRFVRSESLDNLKRVVENYSAFIVKSGQLLARLKPVAITETARSFRESWKDVTKRTNISRLEFDRDMNKFEVENRLSGSALVPKSIMNTLKFLSRIIRKLHRRGRLYAYMTLINTDSNTGSKTRCDTEGSLDIIFGSQTVTIPRDKPQQCDAMAELKSLVVRLKGYTRIGRYVSRKLYRALRKQRRILEY